ncbi:MAG: radical SAM protein, partial [Treponema sp.]|nr:radical SAM protein [Treponema sp.]
MHLTLHLTNKCNLNCKYCFVPHGSESMTRETAFAAVDFSIEKGKPSGLLFYGGEPLLEKELIYDIVDYSKKINAKTGHIFHYKMTTNGTLLDEEFLKFSNDINMTIGLSHDGYAQNDCRLTNNGNATFDLLEEKIPLLLKYHPYSAALCVMDPTTVHNASSTVQFLFDKGFRYISLNLNYSKTASWTKKHLAVLEEEYK